MRAEDRREPTNEELYGRREPSGDELEAVLEAQGKPVPTPSDQPEKDSPKEIKEFLTFLGIVLLLGGMSAFGLVSRLLAALYLPILAGGLTTALCVWITLEFAKDWRNYKTTGGKKPEPTHKVKDTSTKVWNKWPVMSRVKRKEESAPPDLASVLFLGGFTALCAFSCWSAVMWVEQGQWPYAVAPWITTGLTILLGSAVAIDYVVTQIRVRR